MHINSILRIPYARNTQTNQLTFINIFEFRFNGSAQSMNFIRFVSTITFGLCGM